MYEGMKDLEKMFLDSRTCTGSALNSEQAAMNAPCINNISGVTFSKSRDQVKLDLVFN